MTKKTLQKNQHELLVNITKGLQPDQIKHELEKNQVKLLRMDIRISEKDKTDITQTAKYFKLSRTEYLLACHRIIKARLEEDG